MTDKWFECLQSAFDACEYGHVPSQRGVPQASFGMDVNFVGREAIAALENAIDGLLKAGRFTETISEKEMRSQLAEFLRTAKRSDEGLSKTSSGEFRRRLRDIKVEEYTVLRELQGAHIKSSGRPVEIGPFTIYKWDRDREGIQVPDFGDKSVWDEDAKHEYLIGYKVSARDSVRARQVADVAFKKFENFIRFAVGAGSDRYDVRVVRHGGGKLRTSYVFTSENFITENKYDGFIDALPLDDSFFSAPNPTFAHLMRMLAEPRSELEKKILTSVDWIGQALAEHDLANACIKAATALEVLFSQTEGVISPSIVSQLSENCAHILGVNPESAMRTEKLVKDLYGVRSSVVHYGASKVSELEAGKLVGLARSAVSNFIGAQEFREMQSIDEVIAYLKMKKYSWLEQKGEGLLQST